MSNSEISRQLAQQLSVVYEANERYKDIQRKAYAISALCQSNGTAPEHPVFIKSQGKGHNEIPASGGKSEVWEAFSGLPLSVLDGTKSDQYDTDLNIRQKLTDGLKKASRVLEEINKLHEKSAETERYYTERWEAKCKQWGHEAKLKEIWDNNPHLPLFGASEILAGRDPFDPANEFSPGAAGAVACRNEAAAKARNISTTSWYPEEAPWAHQARMDSIEARNYRIWKNGLHDYYHGKNSPEYACVKPRR